MVAYGPMPILKNPLTELSELVVKPIQESTFVIKANTIDVLGSIPSDMLADLSIIEVEKQRSRTTEN